MQIKHFLTILFVLLALKIWSNPIIEDSLKIYHLRGIKIVAKKPEEAIGYVEAKSIKNIDKQSTFTVDESLNEISGLDVSVGGKNGSYLSIRGFSENQIKILIDGQTISPAYMDAVDLTTLPIDEIKEIQVLKGPVSSIYGADTMGGVINIITKEPKKKFSSKFGALFKRNNTNKYYLSIQKKFSFFTTGLSFSRFHTDGLVLSKKFKPTIFEDGKIKDNDAKTSYNLNLYCNFTISDFHQIGLKFFYNNYPLKEITPKSFENKYSKFLDWERYHITLFSHFQLLYNLVLESSLYLDTQSDTYAQYKDKFYQEMEAGWPSYLTSSTFGYNIKTDWEIFGNWLLTNGLRYEKALYKRKDYNHFPEWTSNYKNLFYYYFQNKTQYGKLTLTFGSGFSYYFLETGQNKKFHPEPTIGIYYNFSKNDKISLASGINTNYPTLRQLYSENYGNKNLKEESAWKNELTIEKKIINAKIPIKTNLVLYYNKIKNLIKIIGDKNQNIGKVNSYGFEVNLLFNLFYLEHNFKYSFIQYLADSDIKLIGEPKNKISITESLNLPYKINLSYKFLWKDKRKFLYENSYITLAPYSIHSVYFHKKLKKFNLTLGITNIFDKNYETQYGYPGEGFNFTFSIETKL